ncbi:MAG TPA: hypothetical protein VLI90_15345 [Tepidisphaeraceae bacterium]|nr:hypothetical protein [Tepidisphaeraceae bacterium]
MLACFAALAWSAALTKNATIDEPTHTLSGWIELRYRDFRLEPVNPSLWKCWAALPNLFTKLKVTFDAPVWKTPSFDPQGEIDWAGRTLYDTPGNDGDAFITRTRAAMLLLGIALGALTGAWAYRLAGPLAAIVAVALFSFDPNFVAHAPLAKSDIAFGLVLLALTRTVWRLGQRATIWRVITIGLLCGAAVGTKFSGVIVGPILAVMLLYRALMPLPWDFLGHLIASRARRILAAAAVGFTAAALCWLVTWSAYDFRFRPAPAMDSRMDMATIQRRVALFEASAADSSHRPTEEQVAHWPPSAVSRAVLFLDRHHLLPQAMLAGLWYQHACVTIWPAFLMGEHYGLGRWYYFPLAMLFKTPLATLAAFAIAIVVAIVMRRKWPTRFSEPEAPDESSAGSLKRVGLYPSSWLVACFVIPTGIFSIAALTTHLNIGVRNVLPLYPFFYIAVGATAAGASKHWPRATRLTLVALLIGLLAETLPAWPDYIAFFNTAAGGKLGGIQLLGDSNLDWGQDFKPLAKWQQSHSDEQLFVDFYGTLDPRFYGLRYHPLGVAPDGSRPISDIPIPNGAVLAISANHLQGLYLKPYERAFFAYIAQQRPIDVIGGSLYLYRWPPQPPPAPP